MTRSDFKHTIELDSPVPYPDELRYAQARVVAADGTEITSVKALVGMPWKQDYEPSEAEIIDALQLAARAAVDRWIAGDVEPS